MSRRFAARIRLSGPDSRAARRYDRTVPRPPLQATSNPGYRPSPYRYFAYRTTRCANVTFNPYFTKPEQAKA